MTIVVNFFGGPGSGKSTMAGQLFGVMKEQRINVEYVPEFAKELVWEESQAIDDQLYLLGVQHFRLYRLLGKVDYIISDSPLLLGNHYVEFSNHKFPTNRVLESWRNSYKELAMNTFDMYDNMNFFVNRGERKFVQAGRLQNEDQAKEIDVELRFMLKQWGYPFTTVSNVNDVINMLNSRSENGRIDFI